MDLNISVVPMEPIRTMPKHTCQSQGYVLEFLKRKRAVREIREIHLSMQTETATGAKAPWQEHAVLLQAQ